MNKAIDEMYEEVISWRHHIHKNPELSLKEYKTSTFIKEKLDEFGVPYFDDFTKTGVVAYIRKGEGRKKIALRCEIDALPIHEKNDFLHKSKNNGVMHACGHDGHAAILLGSVKYILKNIDFNGTVYFVFQPGEEGAAGADKMIKGGIIDKCGFSEIYALHNWPGLNVGEGVVISGPVMAGTDTFKIKICGSGGHAAMPHLNTDTLMVASQINQTLNSIVARNVDPLDNAVVSVSVMQSGNATNVMGENIFIAGTVRTFSKNVKKLIKKRIENICKGYAISYEIDINLNYDDGYPVTINSIDESNHAYNSLKKVIDKKNIYRDAKPSMGAEDFSYFLKKIPGNYLWFGNGYSKPLHSDEYDFNDKIIPLGIEYFSKIVQDRLK